MSPHAEPFRPFGHSKGHIKGDKCLRATGLPEYGGKAGRRQDSFDPLGHAFQG